MFKRAPYSSEVKKRDGGSNDDDGDFPEEKDNKRQRLPFDPMREIASSPIMQKYMEHSIRKVVREVIHNKLNRHVMSSIRMPMKHIDAVSMIRYQLQFRGNLPGTLYTGSKIEAEGGEPLEIVILEAQSKAIVAVGPLSSLKVEILVLDGDFGGNGQEEWTDADFSERVVRERDGRKPLLVGKLVITLNNGIGYIHDATFTDNSSWIRSRKFRLGARVAQRINIAGRIQEARSEAFMVKDHRGELNKKNHPPSLNDEVWRLEKIGKDGPFHRRLMENGIEIVQDFLRAYVTDEEKLRKLLGVGMSNKNWEAILEHANECPLDDKIYYYRGAQGDLLLFNTIFKVVGAVIDNAYYPFLVLNNYQKNLIQQLEKEAYSNQNRIVELNETMFIFRPFLPNNMVPDPGQSILCPQVAEVIARQPDKLIAQMDFHHRNDELHGEASKQIFSTKNNGIMEDSYPDYHFGHADSFNMNELLSKQPREDLADVCNNLFARFTAPREQSVTNTYSPNQLKIYETSGAYHVPSNRKQVSSGNWVKLIAALKWILIFKRLSTRKAMMTMPPFSPMAPGMCYDLLGEW